MTEQYLIWMLAKELKNPQWTKQFFFVHGRGVELVTRHLTKTTPGCPWGWGGIAVTTVDKTMLGCPWECGGIAVKAVAGKEGRDRTVRLCEGQVSILFSADTWTEAYIACHRAPFPSVICYSEN